MDNDLHLISPDDCNIRSIDIVNHINVGRDLIVPIGSRVVSLRWKMRKPWKYFNDDARMYDGEWRIFP